MINLIQKEKEILSGLKDFQRATVERVHHLFTHEYARVLVADEVGLGKTMIARGVIAKMARYHRYTLKDDLFKVVYVCSNQSIAGQNLAKLKIDQKVMLDGLSDTRLSMQHLKIFENNFNPDMKDHYIQLIPLTPSTSFDMTGGCGSVLERALMFAILRRYQPLETHLHELEILMMDTATKRWDRWKQDYEDRVEACDVKSNKEYCTVLLEKVDTFFNQEADLLESIHEVFQVIKREGIPGKRVDGASKVIHKMRKMMAEISVDLMDADLVIMDEFQRFPELIDSDGESESALLASKFFNSSKGNEEKVNILLLSATPYKLYSTMEEMSEVGSDEHYKEFMQVTDFLFEKHPDHQKRFKKVWHDYSIALSQMESENIAMVTIKKQKAEDSLYKGIARTERMLVEGASELIDASVGSPLEITENDVLSYIEMDRLLQDTGLKDKVPAEYVKSSPFLMSFMEHYKLKQKITGYFRENREKIRLARKPVLWVNRKVIANYEKLPAMNAKLTKLQELALPKKAERLMWIPPSLPYYELGGPYTGQSRFSKVLAFSAWEMVPRAIATILSYEAERLTVGELIKKTPKKKKDKTRNYFAERRFPSSRLTFAMRDQAPANMNHLTLLYPSITLAKLFNPVDVLNRRLTLEEIKGEIKTELRKMLDQLPYESKEDQSRQDERWYYLAPLLFDSKEQAIQEWFAKNDVLPPLEAGEKEDSGVDKGGLKKHIEELRSAFVNKELPVLGRQPDDLLDVLVRMVLGSPAVCVARMLGDLVGESLPGAVHLAKVIVDRFNTQEAIAIVELEYGKGNNDAHWQNVLKYCVDGNVQAMLDEYAHMLLEEGGLNKAEKQQRNKQLIKVMANSLKTHTASYNVDTYETFKNRILSDDKKIEGGKEPYIKMRTNYAVGFYDTRNEDNTLNRKENIRLSFNSPFRPFVLATTSIGQEGLDFHYYCRKIVHWNLPSNPIDLEQREGRINRYKCLAIRQNIANKYGNIPFMEEDIWQEIFNTANMEERDSTTSELVPFWSLPGNQDIKIERIVPLYPLSRDGVKYNRLMKILAHYRLSLGQARQEELLEYLFNDNLEEDQLKELFINLSPFYKEREKGENK
ncbi:DEAD/DEAH box helicase [Peribacillus frigoritolerans]|uniref:helicase C-terminal domain-containing protein n=1 Tax=Peribacillus frigoritolerans TaxID=450367 RepID=UPI002E20F590|nr:DEAD/DEAH box helicase [Peribacillus frigoritolerans]